MDFWAAANNILGFDWLDINTSNAEATFRFWKPSKPCHVGIH